MCAISTLHVSFEPKKPTTMATKDTKVINLIPAQMVVNTDHLMYSKVNTHILAYEVVNQYGIAPRIKN